MDSRLLDDDLLGITRPLQLHHLLLAVYQEVFLPLDLNIVVVNKANCQLVTVVQTKPGFVLKVVSKFEKPCCFERICEYFNCGFMFVCTTWQILAMFSVCSIFLFSKVEFVCILFFNLWWIRFVWIKSTSGKLCLQPRLFSKIQMKHKCASCFMLRHTMTSWHLNIWKTKIWLCQEQKEFLKWSKKHFSLFLFFFVLVFLDLQNKQAQM